MNWRLAGFVLMLSRCIKRAHSGWFVSIVKEVVTSSLVGSVRGSHVVLPFCLHSYKTCLFLREKYPTKNQRLMLIKEVKKAKGDGSLPESRVWN